MAVSIDTVYQRVLTLANKEQRGYITPQEFNLLANQAQMEIFEQYFHDIKKQNPLPGNVEEYSDPLNTLYEKISIFEAQANDAWMAANMQVLLGGLITIPWDQIYKIGSIFINRVEVDILKRKDFDTAITLPLTAPTKQRPLASIFSTNSASVMTIANGVNAVGDPTTVVPGTGNNLSMNYIIRPQQVEWAYVVINDKALYNDNISIDFQLHSSEETELVYKILKLAGINLKAQEVVQVGQTLEQTNKQTTL